MAHEVVFETVAIVQSGGIYMEGFQKIPDGGVSEFPDGGVSYMEGFHNFPMEGFQNFPMEGFQNFRGKMKTLCVFRVLF